MKETLRITTYRPYQSNAEVFAESKDENYCFHISYDHLSDRAIRDGGETLKRAVIKRLREENPEYKFILKRD